MELLILIVPAVLLIAIVVTLVILGERSLKRQRGNLLRRGKKERNAAGSPMNRYPRF